MPEENGWGRRGPGGCGELPPSARRSPLQPGPRRSPAGFPPAQARRRHLQQSLQEAAGAALRQEIPALSDGQAGRVRGCARCFPAGGIGDAGTEELNGPRLGAHTWPQPGLGIRCAGHEAAGRKGVLPPRQPSSAAACLPLPTQRGPGCQRGVSGSFGLLRCAHACTQTCAHSCRCICAYTCACIYRCICTRVCVFIDAYTCV